MKTCVRAVHYMAGEKHFQRSEVERKEEKAIESRRTDLQPKALRLAGDESLRNVENAANPKQLAREKGHENSEPA